MSRPGGALGLIASLLLLALACRLTTTVPDPTPSGLPAAEQVEGVVPPAAGETVIGTTAVRLQDGLSDINQYRWTAQIQASSDRALIIVAERRQEPPSSSYTIQMSETGHRVDDYLIVEQAGLVYIVWPDVGCTVQSGVVEDPAVNPWAPLLDPDNWLPAISQATLAGQITLPDGRQADHYRVSQADVTGDLYLEPTSGVAIALTAVGQGRLAQSGLRAGEDLTIQYTLTPDFPVEISLNPACPDLWAGQPYPLLPDAYEIVYADNVLLYRSHQSLGQATIFYQEQLAGAGWLSQEEEHVVMVTAVILSYQRGSERLFVSLAAGDDGLNVIVGP